MQPNARSGSQGLTGQLNKELLQEHLTKPQTARASQCRNNHWLVTECLGIRVVHEEDGCDKFVNMGTFCHNLTLHPTTMKDILSSLAFS